MKITLLILLSIFTLSARAQVYKSDEAEVTVGMKWEGKTFASHNVVSIDLNDSTVSVKGEFCLKYTIQRYLYDLSPTNDCLIHYYVVIDSVGHRDVLMLEERKDSYACAFFSYRKETNFIYDGKMVQGIGFNNLIRYARRIY